MAKCYFSLSKLPTSLQSIRDAYSYTLADIIDRRRPHVIDGSVDDILSDSDQVLQQISSNLSGVPTVASLLGAISAQMIAIFKGDPKFLTASAVGQEAVLIIAYLGLISNIIAAGLAFIANNDITRILYQLHRDRANLKRSRHIPPLPRVPENATTTIDTHELKQKYDKLFRKLSASAMLAQCFVCYGIYCTIVSIITFCWYGTENTLGVAKIVTIVAVSWVVLMGAMNSSWIAHVAIITNPLNGADLVRSATRRQTW